MKFTQEICRSIGRQLRETRRANHQTQRELAQLLGVSRQMVVRYEKGVVAPTGEVLAKVARYVGHIDLPGYDYKLTAQALEHPRPAPASIEEQLKLPLDMPQEFPDSTVRITRKEDCIEIFAVVGRAGGPEIG
jgi:transcriptional regulator with XRE-family HTH domain